jgi:CHAD domain-containing protein
MADRVGPYRPLRKQLNSLTREARRIDQGDVDALHRARIASRRLREWLPVLGLDGDTTRKLSRRLRRVTKHLGVVRELDVLALVAHELSRRSRYSSTALSLVGAAVEDARTAARQRLAEKLPFAKLQRLAERLERAARRAEADRERRESRRAHRSRRAWVWALDARAARRAARLRSAIEAAGAMYVPERLHGVRIALKKLRYAIELGSDAQERPANRDIVVLKTALSLLGRLHDLEMLTERARREQASLFPPDLRVWRDLGRLVLTLERDCRTLHARYMSHRAKVLAIADRWSKAADGTSAARRHAVR